MNNKKFCFIICSNDEFATKECLFYIGNLDIPDGYEVQTLVITDAESMCAGYNHGMKETDAKYKIFMHQDVYIVNKGFLNDILKLFLSDSKIGMIGQVGNRTIPESGAAWSDGDWRRRGKVYSDVIFRTNYSTWKPIKGPYEEVVVIDGLLMATQYDIPWREDLFKGWDFYDCSQSLEFIRKGYKIIIPNMDKPWCLHDNDILNLSNYDKWRQVFVEEYKDDYMKWNHRIEVVGE